MPLCLKISPHKGFDSIFIKVDSHDDLYLALDNAFDDFTLNLNDTEFSDLEGVELVLKFVNLTDEQYNELEIEESK